MSKDSHLIVSTWEKIAEYTPFTEQVLRKRFGKEMLALGVIYKYNMPKRMNRGNVIWGIVWKIEKFIDMKARNGLLGMHKSTNSKNTA